MNKTITVFYRSAYGVERCYVIDDTQNKAISLLTGAKTLESRHIDALQMLGFEVKIAAAPLHKVGNSNAFYCGS